MFYILLKNSLTYVNWFVERQKTIAYSLNGTKKSFSLLRSLEYHGSRKVVNLLRGPGHDGEGAGVFLCLTGLNGIGLFQEKQLVIKCTQAIQQIIEY